MLTNYLASLLPYGTNWNLVLLVLAGCSILSFTIFFERLLVLRRSEIDTDRFLFKVREAVEEGSIVNALQVCEENASPVATIVKSGLDRHERGRERIESAMETSGLIEIARLERGAKILSMIGHLAPLIGLLGTVLGFIQAFSEMRISGMVDISASKIGEALEYALVTTAAGLVVAIPSIVAYNYLVSRVESLVIDIQTTASEIVDLICDRETPLSLRG